MSRAPAAAPGSVPAQNGLAGAAARTSLEAIVADPLSEPIPAGWDEFVETQQLCPVWRSPVLGSLDWCARASSSFVLIRDKGSAEPVALFHARHSGPGRPGRFARPGRVPAVGLTECKINPGVAPGFVFADSADQADRRQAFRAFERALRQRIGWGQLALAYRNLYDQHLPTVPAAGRIRLTQAPDMVIDNVWPDVSSYWASLPRRWRHQLRRIQDLIRTSGLQVEFADAVRPEEASWLVEAVNRRYRTGGLARPPWPPRMFAELGKTPGGRFLTYRTESGRLVGCTTAIDDGQELMMLLWGTRGAGDGPHRHLYFDQYRRVAELMVQLGRARLQLGYGMNDIKARYGGRPQPRWTLVGLR